MEKLSGDRFSKHSFLSNAVDGKTDVISKSIEGASYEGLGDGAIIQKGKKCNEIDIISTKLYCLVYINN
jgi:hypothetical protein